MTTQFGEHIGTHPNLVSSASTEQFASHRTAVALSGRMEIEMAKAKFIATPHRLINIAPPRDEPVPVLAVIVN